MTLFKLIAKELAAGWSKVLAFAILSAISSLTVIATINSGVKSPGTLSLRTLILFALACAAHTITFGHWAQSMTGLIESALCKIRIRLAEKVRHAEFRCFEEIGAAELYEKLTKQTAIISNSTWMLTLGIQSLISLVIMGVYISSLSRDALFAMLILSVIGVPIYYQRRLLAKQLIRAAGVNQLALFTALTDFLHGFKEVRLRAKRGDDLHDHFKAIAASLRDRSVESHTLSREDYIFINLNLFLLLALIVFVLPQIASTREQSIVALTTLVIFMSGPLSLLSSSLPEFERAEVAAESIRALELRLDNAAVPVARAPNDPWGGHFTELAAVDLTFQHRDPSGQLGFSIGPLSFSIRAGEIVFFVGGNGSGKTTLLKLLTTLYAPSAGALLVDQIPVAPHNAAAFRELLCAIFTDFHLFHKLYGLSNVSKDQVDPLLDRMQLADRTAFAAGGFTNQELSTGQRKRLAMVIALLEDRPLYVFDEWAADQDPQFRRLYYEELLPELKRRGKTVLAISHDDRYFHCADRVITLEYGAIKSIQSAPASQQALP